MDIKFPLLQSEDIEVKVKQVGAKGAVALLYKTARTDMAMLDTHVGALNWKTDFKEIKGNLYCDVSIWDSEKAQWVTKSDCGIESRADSEGNQKKGEASDAFKRACVQWGIGRELYTAPFVFLKVETEKTDKGFKLKNAFAKFNVAAIGYENGAILSLVVCDNKGNVVFSEGAGATATKTRVSQNSNEDNGCQIPKEISDEILTCENCGKSISIAEHDYSLSKYKTRLCRSCQKSVK